ncbi:hypothetical protein F5Y18DRAFT_392313 [Xylariaceae sp. FL1019]|nr:hypothetical protein F5Y18DRAFT_392313 [Xylariaceae sp. FL1019]
MEHRGSKPPPCPYEGPDFKIEITRHRPPPPFGSTYKINEYRPRLEDEELLELPRSLHVLKYPVVETDQVDDPSKAELTMDEPIQVGSDIQAQVIVCTVTPQCGEPYRAVAKIFDPLYRRSVDEESRLPFDITRRADKNYALEAAAYQIFDQAGLTGNLVPEYYGSWTFSLDNDSHARRSVRLILIEYLDGCSIADLIWGNRGPEVEPCSFPYSDAFDEAYRLEVMAQILDAQTRLMHSGVHHADLCDRNVMVVPDPRIPQKNDRPQSATPRVVIVDFGWVDILHLKNVHDQIPSWRTELPHNPLEPNWSSWPATLSDFGKWMPAAWRGAGDPERFFLERNWLYRVFKDSERAQLYEPLKIHGKDT